MGTRRVVIEFLGQDKSASKTAQDVEKHTSHLGSTMAGVGKTAALGLAGGLLAAGGAAVKFIADAEESARVARLTDAAIKSTGGAAHVTSKQVGDLATAISNKTGADDEAIQSGANLLLTFTNVRNETGKGNDIFNQATSTITDMTAALNGGEVTAEGLKGSSIQLGKALNDPIKGISALQRVGVSFTEGQKKQIKSMVEAGNTLGAQKIILGELNKEFGGAAAAAASPFDRLKVAAGNVSEQLGGYLAPAAEKAASFMANNLPVAMDKAGKVIDKIIPPIKEAARQFGDWLLPKVRQFADWAKANLLPVIKDIGLFLGEKVVPKIKQLAGFVVNTLIPVMQKLYKGALAGVKDAFDRVKKALEDNKPQLDKLVSVIGVVVKWIAEKLGPILGWLAKTAFRLVGVAISLIITGISKLVDAIGWVVKTAPKIGKAFSDAWGSVKKITSDVASWVWQRISGFFGDILNGAAKAFGWVPGLGGKLKNAAKDFGTFRDNVNNKLKGINDQTITIKPVFDKNTMSLASAGRRAMGGPGGPVSGPGTGTSDQAGLYALSNGEHVFTAEEVRKAGGHGAIYRMRQAIRGGGMGGFAAGGAVGFNVRAGIPGEGARGAFAAGVAAGARAVAQPIAQAIAGKLMMGPNAPAGSVQNFRGEKLNSRTIAMLLAAEKILGHVFNIMQGSYSTRVAASGGTHAGGGVMDTDGPGGWGNAVAALRRVGFAAWHRTPAMGPWGHHIHSVAIGDNTAAPSARRQVQDYLRGGDGLGSYQNGTDFVPETGLYRLHRGEKVTPAAANSGDFLGVVRFELELDGKVIQTKLLRLKKLNGGLALGLT